MKRSTRVRRFHQNISYRAHLPWMVQMADAHGWFSQRMIKAMEYVAKGMNLTDAALSAGLDTRYVVVSAAIAQLRVKCMQRTRFLDLVFDVRPVKGVWVRK